MSMQGPNPNVFHSTPFNDDNPEIDRVAAKLLIYTGELRPEDATARLGLEPTKTLRKGARITPEGQRQYPLNGWFLISEDEVKSKDIRRHLDWLIHRLLPARVPLLALQQEPGVQMRLSCVIWTNGGGGTATLWPEHMRAIADLNLECTFEFADYGAPAE